MSSIPTDGQSAPALPLALQSRNPLAWLTVFGPGAVIASLHVHLDAENCLEVLVVRGKSGEIRRIADKLIGTKGVKHGKLTLTTAGSDLT